MAFCESSSNLSAILKSTNKISGLISSNGELSGVIDRIRFVLGTIICSSGLYGIAKSIDRITGSSINTSNLLGIIKNISKIVGIISTNGNLSGYATTSGIIDLVGTSNALGFITGLLSLKYKLVGLTSSINTTTENLRAICSLTSSIFVNSILLGKLTEFVKFVGSINTTSTLIINLKLISDLLGVATTTATFSASLAPMFAVIKGKIIASVGAAAFVRKIQNITGHIQSYNFNYGKLIRSLITLNGLIRSISRSHVDLSGVRGLKLWQAVKFISTTQPYFAPPDIVSINPETLPDLGPKILSILSTTGGVSPEIKPTFNPDSWPSGFEWPRKFKKLGTLT